MKAQSLIERRIKAQGDKWNLLVLKKFPTECLLALADKYEIFDNDIYENGKINLKKIDASQLFVKLVQNKEKKGVISYESFIKLTNMIRNLSAADLNVIVLENNLLQRFENPGVKSVPDFDSPDLQDEQENADYALYYSFCSHENGKEFIEYINPDLENESQIKSVSFIDPKAPIIDEISSQASSIPTLSFDDDSLIIAMERLFFEGTLPSSAYIVDKVELSDHKEFGILQNAATKFGGVLSFVKMDDSAKCGYRPELLDTMKEIWGYDSFRNISTYKNLYAGKETMDISQGDIIETVIQQAEIALGMRTDGGMHNVLLTAPTGAGKSILFQLPAIYLASKYQALTIVVSPLVALMSDQVNELTGKYEGAATLNSMVSAAEKARVMEGVLSGQVNLLYLAPELLLSYSISTFIGTRRIGLFIIDEAHTVTTWGRDFRVDYWFLGDYLRTQKRYLGYSFPLFALTATAVWDPSGRNDMVFDTIRSLNMDPCLKYIGVVKRSNIIFDINNPRIVNNYEREKETLTVSTIKKVLGDKKKAIVYFPYKRTIYNLMKSPEISNLGEKVVPFHADLLPSTKALNARNFKDGISPVICATKAFGMGINVPDINIVYHYAPTGSLSDYVQEIGRLARDPQLTGIAKIDFSDKDFRFTRTLHGLSAIKPYQLKAVLKKLMSIYYAKGEKRNMLITADDFAYIFPGKDVNYDQKLKSCLLLLSHDLLDKYGFYSLIVRPKSLFTKTFLRFKDSATAGKFKNKYSNYVKRTFDDRVLQLESDTYWEDNYSDISFPNFKYQLANNCIFKEFEIELVVKIDVTLNDPNPIQTKPKLENFFAIANQFLDEMARTRHRIEVSAVEQRLPNILSADDKEAFMESFKGLYTLEGAEQPYCNIVRTENGVRESFQLVNDGYRLLESRNLFNFKKYFEDAKTNKISSFCAKDAYIVKLAELLNSLNLASYQKSGGDEPAIFVRINNPYRLSSIVRSGNYTNKILQNIYERYAYSERIFTYFFTTDMNDNKRWEFIEDYFLGASEEDLMGTNS